MKIKKFHSQFLYNLREVVFCEMFLVVILGGNDHKWVNVCFCVCVSVSECGIHSANVMAIDKYCYF